MEEQSYLNLKKGIYYLSNQEYSKASEEFLKSLQKKESSMGYALYGASLYWLGDNQGAMENYEKAIKIDPKNDVAWQLEGISLARDGRLNDALERFIKSYNINPSRGDTAMNISSVYFSIGNTSKATEYARKAISLDPKNPLYYYQLGLIKFYEENFEEALKNFKTACEIEPSYQDAVLWYGISLEVLGKDKEAIKKYEKAIDLKPRDFFARYKLALLSLKQQRFKKEILIPCFELYPSQNSSLTLTLSYSVKKNTSDSISQMLDDIINNSSDGDEITINVDAFDEKHQFTLTKPKQYENSSLSKALSERFSKEFKKTSHTFKLVVDKKSEEFKNQVKKIKSDIKDLSSSHTRLNISTDVKKNKQEKEPKELVYIPRNVGNDMGLWLVGNPWLYLIEEELENQQISTDSYKNLIIATGWLISANTQKAKEILQTLKEEIPDISNLALGVVEYLEGNRDKAIEYLKKATKFEKTKKTAEKNLRYLNGDK